MLCLQDIHIRVQEGTLAIGLDAGSPCRAVPRDVGELAQDGVRVALRDPLTVEDDEVPEVRVGPQQSPHPRRGDPLAAVQVHAVKTLHLLAQSLQGFVGYLLAGSDAQIRNLLTMQRCYLVFIL